MEIESCGRQKVITKYELLSHMNKKIQRVKDYGIQESSVVLRRLLNAFEWDIQKSMIAYYDDEIEYVPPPMPNRVNPKCLICFTKLPPQGLKLASCGHVCCGDCWRTYVQSQIVEKEAAFEITCPAEDCNWPLEDECVIELFSDEEWKERYWRLIANGYVQSKKRQLRWCPNLDCDRIVRTSEESTSSVRCDCGKAFCFRCGEEPHDPASCSRVHEGGRPSNDSGTCDLAIGPECGRDENEKNCPNCNVPNKKEAEAEKLSRCFFCFVDFCWDCERIWLEGCICETSQSSK